MSQPQTMNMAAMAGGPVGGGPMAQQQMGVGTPGANPGAGPNGHDPVKRLNTAIYDYLLRNQMYDTARLFVKGVEIETDTKKSPNSRPGGQQANGNVDDGMDLDSKEIQNRPDDLPAPLPLGDGSFLQDWWCQFWEIFQGHRQKGKPSTHQYIGHQRQAQKARTNMMGGGMDPAAMQNMRAYNQVMPGMNNAMAMTNDLKRQAMQNPRNLTPQQRAQMAMMSQQNAQMQANQMERQGSQLGLEGPRSGSPGSGEAPSPKRQRLEGNMQQMNPGRPGPQGPMQANPVGLPSSNSLPPSEHHILSLQTQQLLHAHGIDHTQIPPQQLLSLSLQPANVQAKAVETYSQSIHQQMKAAMSSNVNKGMPPNAAAAAMAAQGSPMGNVPMDPNDFYNNRMPNVPNTPNIPNTTAINPQQAQPAVAAAAAAAAAGGAPGPNQGNHALQDYQMQLMLLEQQNKKRLLMARQEQDSMTGTGGGPGPNGQYQGGMSPSGVNRGSDGSPGANEMPRGTPNMKKAGMSPNGDMAGRASPQPGMIDPNMPTPQMRAMMQQNGAMMRGMPPSSHPMGAQMTPEQMSMFQRQPGMQMPNGAWPTGPQAGGPQMMPGQQPPGGPPQQGQPAPNMTPRPGNMGPPAPPGAQNGTQPSSPAQPPAPPTPSQTNKAKPGSKKSEAGKKGANKKNAGATGATPATESEQAPPTPTPATPMTPMHQNAFNHQQNKNMANGGPNGPPNVGQGQAPNQAGNGVQIPAPGPADMGGQPFGSLDGSDQFGGMSLEFANLDGGDVLDNFDFDSFLNNDDTGGGFGFDANLAFGDASLEAGPDLGGN